MSARVGCFENRAPFWVGRSFRELGAIATLAAMSTGRSPAEGAGRDRATQPSRAAQMTRFGAGLAVGLARRPHLVPTALRQLLVMAPRRWWAHEPHLPIPPSDYLAFRQVTATGRADGLPEVGDTLEWLEWCRSMQAVRRR